MGESNSDANANTANPRNSCSAVESWPARVDAGVAAGLPRDLATTLAQATLVGSARLLAEAREAGLKSPQNREKEKRNGN